MSLKTRSVPASTAVFLVSACQRSTATSTYRGSISIAQQRRAVVSAAMMVVPLPGKGS